MIESGSYHCAIISNLVGDDSVELVISCVLDGCS